MLGMCTYITARPSGYKTSQKEAEMPEGSAKITPKEVADNILEKINALVVDGKLDVETGVGVRQVSAAAVKSLDAYISALDAVTRYAGQLGLGHDDAGPTTVTVVREDRAGQ